MPLRKAPLPRDFAKKQAPPEQQEDNISYAEFRNAFTMLAQALANKANREVVIPLQAPTMETKIHDFMRINQVKFNG